MTRRPQVLHQDLSEAPPDEDLWAGEDVLPVRAPQKNFSHAPPPAPDRLIRGSHVELGERLLAAFAEQGTLIHADDALWQCNGKQYFEKLDDSAVERDAHRFDGAAVAVKKNKPLAMRQSDVKGAISVLKAKVDEPAFFRDAPIGVSFRDCFVRADGAELLQVPNGPENRARHQLPFDYVPNAGPPPKILRFFSECFEGTDDASERVYCLQQFVGLSLLGLGTKFHRALVLLGGGANGKSVFVSLIQRAFPSSSVAAVPAQRWDHEYYRAALAGRLLNAVSELPESDIIDSASFKSIISGDVTGGRRPYGEPFDFIPQAGHVFATNSLPGMNDQTQGFWRRFIVIGFPNAVPVERQNPNLVAELSTELPEFVGWCLAGAAEALAQNQLTTPASSAPALKEWRLEADQVASFLGDATEPDPEFGVSASELYRQYRGWAATNGHRTLSSVSFGKRAILAGAARRHTSSGNVYLVKFRRQYITA